METHGNATAYTGGTTHRPIPHASDLPRRGTHAPPAPKKSGIDWDATRPTCKGCGERSGQLGAGALCPTCRGADLTPSNPANVTSVGEGVYVTLPAEDVERRYVDNTRLGRELAELEATNPDVAAAAESLDHQIHKITHPEDHVDPDALEVTETPQDEAEAVVPPTPPRAADPRENAAPPRPVAPTRTQELDAQINHATRVLRDTADLDNPAARLLRLNALSAIEALYLFTQMYPQAPASLQAEPTQRDSSLASSGRDVVSRRGDAGQTTERASDVLGGTPEGGDRKGKAARPPVTRRPRPMTDDDHAIVARYADGETAPNLARTYNTTPKRVRALVERAGITLRDDRKGHSGSGKLTTEDDDPQLREEVVHRYTAGESTPTLAVALGTSAKHINSILRRANVTLRPRASIPRALTEAEARQAVADYVAGIGLTKIALGLHVKKDRIRALLVESGIEIRPHGGVEAAPLPDGAHPAQIRAWAISQGLTDASKGRLPRRVLDAYTAAHEQAAS